ncbi:MAG TPA: DUF2934 domain-containing protein [Candidatus Binataceae bacterium]|jgi:hypothetical protein
MAAPRKPKTAGVRTKKSNPKPAAVANKAAAPAATASASNGNGAPSVEMIRLRAYEVFLARNGAQGDEVSDWLIAEREIMEKFAHD